jgi:hypothetical protein
MIAYNNKALDNLAINEQVAAAWEQNLITQEEATAIAQACPVKLYSPNIFIRTGLFFLTVLTILMCFGLFFMIAFDAIDRGHPGILTLVFSLLTYGGAEFVIRERNHYRSGIDDAMMWSSMVFMIVTVPVP